MMTSRLQSLEAIKPLSVLDAVSRVNGNGWVKAGWL